MEESGLVGAPTRTLTISTSEVVDPINAHRHLRCPQMFA
jgi:hypothetical protein